MHSFVESKLNVLNVLFKRFLNFILTCKQWYYELNPVKIVAIILINSILLTFVYGQSIAQVTQNVKATEQFKQIFNDFILPYSYGKITSANYAGSDVVIINIQDLHLHPEAQKNIANIISTFDKNFGLKNVYLEGAYGQLDMSWLAKNVDDKDKKETIINSILATGALTGAEYYSAISNKLNLVKGIESKEPYLDNLKRFGDILYSQNEIIKVFNSMEDNIKYLKSLYFNKKQKRIEDLSKRYVSGDLDAKKYFILLNKYADSLGVDLNKYENVNLYIKLLNLGREIDYERSTKELQLLILKLKELLPYGAYKMILDSTSDFSDIDRLYTYLVRLARQNNINLSINFPELNKFLGYIELSEKINPMDMLKEEQRLRDEINIAFAYDIGEKEVSFLSGFLPYLKDYLSSKITSDDYHYYENNIKKFKRLWIKYVDNQKLRSLSKYEDRAETFYKINLDRNNYFMENIDSIKDVGRISKEEFNQDLPEVEKVIQSLKEAKNISMVITGGFHTQGVADLLKEKGISYVVITPNVSGDVKLAEDAYYALAKEQSKILFQALATLNLSQMPENLRPVMFAEVLIRKGYTIDVINEALKEVLASGETAQLQGNMDNLDTLKVTVTKNGQTITYNYKNSSFEVASTNQTQTQKETQAQGSQKSRSSIWSAVKSFVAISVISAAIVAGSGIAIGLTVVTGFLWFLVPLIIFSLLFVGNIFSIGYELSQYSFLAKEDSAPSDVPEDMTDIYVFKKILQSLPQNLAKEFAAAALQVNLDQVDDLLYGYTSDLAEKLRILNLSDEGAAMESFHGGIKINYSLIRSKFFDKSGKNIENQRMLEVFVKHELRHEYFRKSAGFVHSKPWLEELLVSILDLLDAICNVFRSLFGSTQSTRLTDISVNSYSNLEQSLTVLLGRESREISKKIQTFCMLNPNSKLTKDILMGFGLNSEDAKVLAAVKFSVNTNVSVPNFEDILSSTDSLELIKQLVNSGNVDAIVVAKAIELLGYTSADAFEEFKNIARASVGDNSVIRFARLKETLIQRVNDSVVLDIRNGEELLKSFSKGFQTPQLIAVQSMLASQNINENDIKAVIMNFYLDNNQTVISFQGLFDALVKQNLVEKLYTSIEDIFPQGLKTQQTKDVLFNSIVRDLSINLGNLTGALANAKELLLNQVIDKNQNELDLLSVSLAKQKQDVIETTESNLAVLDKNIDNALMEYSFGVVDQSQYNQQTLEFVNIIKDAFITENSWEQLKNKDTRDKLANFLKQYYDAGIIDVNLTFLESMTSKDESLNALSSLIASSIKNRRIYNDVNLQRSLADLFPLSMQYAYNTILNGESLILQKSIDQEGFVSDIKTYMLILADLNSFSTENTPEKQRIQSLIANYGKYALLVLDYPINNESVAFKNGSRLRGLRTSLFNIVKDLGVDVSNIEYPQDRLFVQQQPQLTQTEQERLLTELPAEIANLEKQARDTKNSRQILKKLNNSQNKLDDAIFAGQNVSVSAKRIVNTIRNITQAIIDRGDFSLEDLEELKDIAQQCRHMVLATNSDSELNINTYDASVILPLDILIQQKSANVLDIKTGLSMLTTAIGPLLRFQADFNVTIFEDFFRNKDDRNVNFALKEGEISNLYIALTLSRFATVLDDIGSVDQTLTTDLETGVTSRSQTAIILERLRYWLPSGSAAKEFARVGLVNIVNDTIAKFKEVLEVGEGRSDRITLANLNTLESLQLAQSDYQQSSILASSVNVQTGSQIALPIQSTASTVAATIPAVQQLGEPALVPSFETPIANSVSYANEAERAAGHSLLWYIGVTIVTIGIYWLVRLGMYLFGHTEVDNLVEKANALEALSKDSNAKSENLINAANAAVTELENSIPTSAKEIELKRQAVTKIVEVLNRLIAATSLSQEQKKGLKQKLIIAVQEQITITKMKFSFVNTNSAYAQIQTIFRQLMIDSVSHSIDISLLHDVSNKNIQIHNKLIELFNSNSNLSDVNKLQEIKRLLNFGSDFQRDVIGESNLIKRRQNLRGMLSIEAKKLSDNARGNVDKLMLSVLLSKIAFARTDVNIVPTVISQNVVTLANTLNQLVSVYGSKRNTAEENNIKSMLSTLLQLEISITDGISQGYMPGAYYEGVLESRISLEEIFSKLNITDREQALRYIRQRKEVLANKVIFSSDGIPKSVYRGAIANLDKLIAFTAPEKLIQEQFPYDAGYFKILKESQDNTALLNIMQDTNKELRYRLYAFAQLKAKGINKVGNVNIDSLAGTFKEDIKAMLQAKSLKHTESYFDLRVMVIGIHLVASEEVIKEVEQAVGQAKANEIRSDNQKTYRLALQANFAESYGDFNADSNLNFARGHGRDSFGKDSFDSYYTVIAHELGHRYLYSLGLNSTTKARSMFHEQFADSVSGVFNSFLLQNDISKVAFIASESKTFKAFIPNQRVTTQSQAEIEMQAKARETASQEEHSAARGLTNSIKATLTAMGKQINFRALLKASIVLAVTGSQALFGVGQQSEVAREVIFGVSNAMEEIDPTFDKGEFIYQFISKEGVKFKSLQEEQTVFGDNNSVSLVAYLNAKQRHNKKLSQEEQEFLRNTRVQNRSPGAASPTTLLQRVGQIFSFADQISRAEPAESRAGHSLLWYIGMIVAHITLVPAIVYWLYRLFSIRETAGQITGQKSVQKEIDGSVDSIVEVLNASLTNIKIQDNIFDGFIEELEQNLNFVKNRPTPDSEKKEEAIKAGELFKADIENLLNLITNLKADNNFTRGQKLAIAQAIVRSWALAVANDTIRMAMVADPSDIRTVSASIVQNGVTDKVVLDALNNFFAGTSNLTTSQITDLAYHANDAAVDLQEYEKFAVAEYENLFAQEENIGRFGVNELDIKEIAKQIQLLHLLHPELKISVDVLRQIGVGEGLDEILAKAMSKVKFSEISVSVPKFSTTFSLQATNNMPQLLSNLVNSGYPSAIVIANAIEILGLNAQGLEDIINSIQASRDTKMFSDLQKALLNEIDKKVYKRLSNKENMDRVLNWALPTNSVMALRKLKELEVIDNASISQIASSLQDGSDLIEEIVYQKVVQLEYEKISTKLPENLNAELVKREISKRISNYLRYSKTEVDNLSIIANVEFAAVLTEQLISDVTNNGVDDAKELQQLSNIYAMLSGVLSKDEIDNIIKDSSPGIGAALVADNLTKLANGRAWVLRAAASLARFSLVYIDVVDKEALDLKTNARNILASALNELVDTTQPEQEILLTELPEEIENLEEIVKENPNDKQAAKNLNKAQSDLDDMIFANQDISEDTKQIVEDLRNITQEVIDKGTIDQKILDQIKSFIMQCKPMILSSNPDMDENDFEMMFEIHLEQLQNSLNDNDVNRLIGSTYLLLEGVLLKLSKMKNISEGISKFLETENDETVNPPFVEGDISNLYISLTISRLVTVLDTVGSRKATLISDLEPSLVSREKTIILLERLRYGLKPGSISREFARVNLVSTFKNYLDRYQEVLEATQGQVSTRTNQKHLDANRNLVFAQSDYGQQEAIIQTTPALELPVSKRAMGTVGPIRAESKRTEREEFQNRNVVALAAMQESVASAKFTSIRAGILAFFNTGGFVSIVVLLSLSIITGLGAVIAAAIGASFLAIIGTMSIMSSIYESNQKKVIKELGQSGELLPTQESRLVFANLVRSLPQETAIKLVQATFNDVNLANDYLNIVSGTNWQTDIETNEAIINAINGAMTNDNSVVMETTDVGRILFSPYIVRSLLNNPTMLRIVAEHELHHLEYAKATSSLSRFIHRTFPGLEEFIVSFRNVFRLFRARLQDKFREFRGVSVVWNLPEGLALGDVLVKKVNEQGFIDVPNIQTGHVQLADGRRGTLSYKVTRNGLEIPNFEFGKTKFDVKDIGDVKVTYTFTPDTYTLSFETNAASSTPVHQEIKSGEALRINGVTNLPQRAGYQFNGYKYVNAEGKVRTITNQEVIDGFDIPPLDSTGDLKLQALWIAEVSNVEFVNENGIIITFDQAAVTGQNIRIAGLGRLSGARRLVNALVGERTGIKTQKITWNLPSEISAPEGLPSEIEESVSLNAPLIAEGRVQLNDGRFGTVKRIVRIDGRVVENFQFGTTPINGELNIEYTFTPESYSINFVANGASANVPQVANSVLLDGEVYHVNATAVEQLPTKPGYLFKGYTYTNRDGRTVSISRLDVISGFDIAAQDITGDIDLVVQWTQREESEQYEVEFSNASLSSIADNLNNEAAVFGKPYIIDHNVVKRNVSDLVADNWEVTGYVVSVNGVDIMKVQLNDMDNISDVTVPAQDIVGKLNIRFLRNPKVTFKNEFLQDQTKNTNLLTIQLDESITTEQLTSQTPSFTDAQGTVGHWSRSDGKDLAAPITEPITFTYSKEFYNVDNFKSGNLLTNANVFVLLFKWVYSVVKGIGSIIINKRDLSRLSIIKNAFKSLSFTDVVKVICSTTIMIGIIALLFLVSVPGLFSLLLIAALLISIANVGTILFGPIAKGVFKTLRDKASSDMEIQQYDYYLEVLDLVINIVGSKTSSSKVFSGVRVAMYISTIAVVMLSILAIPSVGVLVIAASWAVPLAGVVFGVLVLGLLGFMIYKYNKSRMFKSIIDILWNFFKNSSLKFKINVIIGMFVSIGALAVFFIVPLAAGLSFLILLGAIAMFAAVISLFFTYNTNKFYQTTRDILLENLAGEDQPNAERIRNIIANYEEGNYGVIAKESFMLLVDVVGVKQLLISTATDALNGIYGAVTGLGYAIVNPLTYKVIYMFGKGAYIFGKQAITDVVQTYSNYIYAGIKNTRDAVVNYATNIYDNMTNINITSSLDAIPVREGFKFDGYEITSENSDVKTIITAGQANADFAAPANMVNGKVTIKVRWEPNISINTGYGTSNKLGFSTKASLEADASNGVVNLGYYAGRLTPPAGYDYGSLYWASDLFPGQTFTSNEIVKVDKPGSFTPNWKPLPQVRVAIGQGSWKNRSEGETSTQREVSVSANVLGGSNIDLRKLAKELQAPQDCDPNSLYWVSDADPSVPIANGVVTTNQNTTYIPRWKKLSEVGKARIKTGEGPNDFIIGTRTKKGTIDLTNISKKLKTPTGYKEGTLYWVSDADPTKRFTGIINAEDAANISVLTPHWEEYGQMRDTNLLTDEQDLDFRDSFADHPVRFLSGVGEGEIDNVNSLPLSLKGGYQQGTPGYTFPGFTNSWFDLGQYWAPVRQGYKLAGVRVVSKNRHGEVVRMWNFDAKPDGTIDSFNIDSDGAVGPLEISMVWISNEELAKQEVEQKAAQEKVLAQQKQSEEKSAQEKLLEELKTAEEKSAKEKELAKQKRIEQEKAEQETTLADQKAVQEKALAQEKAEEESLGKKIPLQLETGIMKEVKDSLTSNDFPIKFGQDFHFPGLVERGYLSWLVILGNRKWLPQVNGFEFDGFEIVIAGKTINISRKEAIEGFDIKKEDLQYKNISDRGIMIRPKWKRVETKQKSQETASQTAVQAAQIASTLATDAAKMTMPDKLAQVPLMVMSKLMSIVSEFESYQTKQITIAQESVNSLDYYMEIDDSAVLDAITNSLPSDVKDSFSKNVSTVEDNSRGVVMSFNINDGKIHVNYKMLRAMFFDMQGNIKNQDLLEVFVKHELRHKSYVTEQDQFSKMVHNVGALEEIIVSMGDIYDWAKLHPELTSMQANYEEAIAFVMSDPALVAIAAKVGRKEAFTLAQAQSRLYYREIEDQVINLVAPTYAQEPNMFNNADMRKSPRLIVVNSQIGTGSAELGQAQVFKDGGYSTALVEHISQGASIESYRIPVNMIFSVNGQALVYDVYVKEVNGIHVIGLKLKDNINKDLDTAENYAKAVLVFTKNVNNNSVLRREFNTLKDKTSQMYEIGSDLEINSNGISMLDFSGLKSEEETIDVARMIESTIQQDQGQVSVTEGLSQEDLKGVYIVNDLEISQGTLQTIDQDIKAEEIFKLDEPEKFYQINVSVAKLDSKFIERAVRVKMDQGATAIILDVTEAIDIMSAQGANKLLVALAAIHSLGLKAVMKVDMSRGEMVNNEIFKKLFELGFDGINMNGQKETDVMKLKEKLDLLKETSEKYTVGARNTIELKDDSIKEALKESLGEKGFEGYNTLLVTEVDNTTGETKVETSKIQKALNKGYDRARRLGELQIVVNASNLEVMKGLLTTKAEVLTAGQIREAINQAGLNEEVVKHIEKLLKGTTEQEQGTARVLEALGFARGLVEASLVTRYMNAFDFTQEVYQANSVTDRQALGVVLVKAYLANPEKFVSKESLQQYFKEAESTIIQESSSTTFEQQRAVMASYVNSVTNEIETLGLIESKEIDKMKIFISLAVLNDSINKISFNRIVEDARRRTKISTNAVKSILGAA
jgi:predicted TIM-barrel fold metal-dependent hydrolase